MSKHTPGPWTHKRFGDDEIVIEVGDSTGWRKSYPNAYVCKIGGWGYAGNGNADLITAAPEMLDALELAKEILQERSQESRFKPIWDAIAKAKGENNG